MNNLIALSLLFVAGLFGVPLHSIAGETVEVRVAIDHWPPWKIVENDQFGGIDMQILHEIEQQTNLRFTPVECPWRRCLEMMRNGTVDMITSLTRTPERETFVSYVEPPYFSDSVIFFVSNTTGISVEKYDDLYGKRVGVIKGAAYFPRFDADDKLNKVSVSFDQQLFRMLETNRIDLYAVYKVPGTYMTHKFGYQGLVKRVGYHREAVGLHYFALSKQSELVKLLPLLKDEIHRLQAEGRIEEIINGSY